MNLSFEHDVSLARLNTFGVEARAAHFVRIETIDQIQALRSSPEWTNARRLVLGGGSNLLLTRDFDGLVVLIALKGRTLQLEDDSGWIVRVAAGENWDEFVRWTLASGWNGLENLALIPGTVGAAPIQNIGAYGVELRDRFHGLEGVDLESGRVVAMLPAQCEFGYRDSVFKRNLRDRFIITGVGFRLPKLWQPALDYGDIRAELAKRGVSRPTPTEIADVISTIRRAKLPDPAVIGNAGSFFKNPLVSAEQHETLRSRDPLVVSFAQPDGRFKLAAGWLVEQCGWKGRALAGSSGRAAVHDKQALVLVNRGGASGEEILALARAIQQSVQKRFGVELEPEPVIV